jgi:hypothetical protein
MKVHSRLYLIFTGIVLVSIYLFFPSANLSLDGIGYGADVKYVDGLFAPHHLLFNFFNFIIFRFVSSFFEVDVLQMMQFLNGIFAVASLFILYRIIFLQSGDNKKAAVLTFFAGASFGIMRFAVEAETYVIPLFFSLLASLFFLKFIHSEKIYNVFFVGIFISIAILFHQIHLFWGIGLFIGFVLIKNIRALITFSILSLLVPLVYVFVLVFYNETAFSFTNLFQFIADYYYSDDADTHIGWINFLVTPITFFRTFFQVHGIVIEVFRLMPILFGLIPILVFLMYKSVRYFWTSFQFKSNIFSLLKKSTFKLTHLIVFLLQFLFAFYSHGNSEFMIMLPFVLVLFVPVLFSVDVLAVKYFTITMIVWNFFFGIFPNHVFNFQNNQALVQHIIKHPKSIYILKEPYLIANEYYYKTGDNDFSRFIDANEIGTKVNLTMDEIYFSDILTKKIPFNRGNVVINDNELNIVLIRHSEWINNDLGGFYIDEVKLKNGE